MIEIKIFDNQIILNVSEDDWFFLCENRFFSSNPTIEEIESEFITGTAITRSKSMLWKEATIKFSEYVEELKEILGK